LDVAKWDMAEMNVHRATAATTANNVTTGMASLNNTVVRTSLAILAIRPK
jgi:hypothetical protein